MIEIKVTLRVASKIVTLSALTDLLGHPTRGMSVGEVVSGRKPHPKTVWLRESTLSKRDSFDAHLTALLDFLEGARDKLRPVRQDCEVDFFCMLSTSNGQGTGEVSVSSLRRLVEFDASLVLDVYTITEGDE